VVRCRVTQTTCHDSPGIIIFNDKDLGEFAVESPPTGAANTHAVGKFFTFDK